MKKCKKYKSENQKLKSNKRINKTQLKTTRLTTNLYTINKNDLQTNTSKIDGIAFRGGAHIQQGS